MSYEDPDDLEGQDPDEAADSSPPKSGDAGASNPDTEELEAANARLRTALRAERATRLVERYSLPTPYASLLKDVPRDRQEQQARQYADELARQYPASARDPDLDPVASAPSTPTPTDESSTEDPNAKLREEIRGTRSWPDLAAVQNAQPRGWEKDREAARGATVPEEAKQAGSWDEFSAAIDKARAEARGRT